jgi:hypothetical protein
MSDFKPLRESTRDDFAKSLIDSAFLDEPPRRSLRRTAAFLGVGEAALATLLTSSALGAAPEALGTAAALGVPGSAGVVSASAASGGKVALLGVLKWLGAGAVVGAITAGGVEYAADSAPSRDPAPAAAAPRGTAVGADGKLARSREGLAPSDRLGDPPSVELPRTSAESSGYSGPDPKAENRTPNSAAKRHAATEADAVTPVAKSGQARNDAPALDGEIGRLDRARAALARGSPGSALAELDAFDRERKSGVLEREAAVLRIDALLSQGNRDGARALARRYVAAHPDDTHARRLRALLEAKPEPPVTSPR